MTIDRGAGVQAHARVGPPVPRVLIVDADPAARGRIVAAVRSGDWSQAPTAQVATVAHAVEAVRADRPDCVLLALDLPEAGGLGAVDAVCAADPSLAVVVLSEAVDDDLVVDSLTRGAQDHLVKGELAGAPLQRTIRNAIARAAATDELVRMNAHHRAVLESLGEGVMVHAVDGHVEVMNDTARALLGAPSALLGGRGTSSIPTWDVVDENGAIVPIGHRPTSRAILSRQAITGAVVGVREHGEVVRWLEVDAYPLFAAGEDEPHGVVTTLRDVTDRRARDRQIMFQARLLDAVGQAVVATGPDGCVAYANAAAQKMLGFDGTPIIGRAALELLASDEMRSAMPEVREVLDRGESWTGEITVTRADGTKFRALLVDTPVYDDDQRIAVIGVMTDIDDLVHLTEQREEDRRQLAEAQRIAKIGSFEVIPGLGVNRWSDGLFALAGIDPEGFLPNVDYFDTIHPDDHDEMRRVFAEVARAGGRAVTTCRLLRADGEVRWVHIEADSAERDGRQVLTGVVQDITERKIADDALEYQATHDPLTGLPNRLLVERHLQESIDAGSAFGLLFFDLDRFKVINDALGHRVGDQVLIAVAARVRACVRAGDVVARYGGDEFLVLLRDIVSEAEVVERAREISDALVCPIVVDGLEHVLTSSIGIKLSRAGDTTADYLRDVDVAMYLAKSRGGGHHVVFDDTLRARADRRLRTENALRRAIERRELEVVYQPVVRLSDEQIVGVEALARWTDPERGAIPPSEFIPLAEESGLIVPLGELVLETATLQLQRWETEDPAMRDLWMSVNLSARQLGHRDLPALVRSVTGRAGIGASRLHLEITESVLMDDIERSVASLRLLAETGVVLSVDDFGTGYSSLNYLKHLPVEVLKIDRSFVSGAGRDIDDTSILRAIVNLATALGLETVAEGVETSVQRDVLRALGCGYGQGFLWSPGVAPAVLQTTFAAGRHAAPAARPER